MKNNMENIISIIIPIIIVGILVFGLYADQWGQRRCKRVNGNWIFLNGGKHCIDKDFNEIDIYK